MSRGAAFRGWLERRLFSTNERDPKPFLKGENMKTSPFRLEAALAIIALALASFALPETAGAGGTFYPHTAQTTSTSISKKKLKQLLSTATTAADHQQIAAYYREESQRLALSSKQHVEMAAVYVKKPPVPNPKGGAWFGAVAHCQRLARLDAAQAKEADALAALHEGEAKAAEYAQQ